MLFLFALLFVYITLLIRSLLISITVFIFVYPQEIAIAREKGESDLKNDIYCYESMNWKIMFTETKCHIFLMARLIADITYDTLTKMVKKGLFFNRMFGK